MAASADGRTPLWDAFTAYNAGVTWRGVAVAIDPMTAMPTGARVCYSQYAEAARGAVGLIDVQTRLEVSSAKCQVLRIPLTKPPTTDH